MKARVFPCGISLVIACFILLCVSVAPVMAADGQSNGAGSYGEDTPNWGPDGWRFWVTAAIVVLVVAGTTAIVVCSGGTTITGAAALAMTECMMVA
jgi:hypothetical protein